MSKLNAHALLTSQGWRGKGHSLHPTNDDTGLKHHILIKREGSDGRGLGSRKDHKQEAWWMNAFDQALKGIDTTSGSMKQMTSGGKLDLEKITARGVKKYTGNSGLYTCFVRGGLLKGSVESTAGLLTPPDSGAGTPAAEERQETKEERRTRRAEKRRRKAEERQQTGAEERARMKAARKAQKKAAKEALRAGETKEQRRARREARRTRKEEKRRTLNVG